MLITHLAGARWLLDLAFDGLLVCGAINHPSLVEDAHLERLAGLDFPVLFNVSLQGLCARSQANAFLGTDMRPR
jgi:hypothetical protein